MVSADLRAESSTAWFPAPSTPIVAVGMNTRSSSVMQSRRWRIRSRKRCRCDLLEDRGHHLGYSLSGSLVAYLADIDFGRVAPLMAGCRSRSEAGSLAGGPCMIVEVTSPIALSYLIWTGHRGPWHGRRCRPLRSGLASRCTFPNARRRDLLEFRGIGFELLHESEALRSVAPRRHMRRLNAPSSAFGAPDGAFAYFEIPRSPFRSAAPAGQADFDQSGAR